jgi:hypothetical protein
VTIGFTSLSVLKTVSGSALQGLGRVVRYPPAPTPTTSSAAQKNAKNNDPIHTKRMRMSPSPKKIEARILPEYALLSLS